MGCLWSGVMPRVKERSLQPQIYASERFMAEGEPKLPPPGPEPWQPPPPLPQPDAVILFVSGTPMNERR
jgi:hypothetical protein